MRTHHVIKMNRKWRIKLLNVSPSTKLWWMIQHYSQTALRPVSIAWETERVSEVVLNVMAKSKYVSQPDIEHRPPSDCTVPAYFVQLLAAKVLGSIIRSNAIFSLHIPCGAQCGLSFSAELHINAEPGGGVGEKGGVVSWAKTPNLWQVFHGA